MYWLPDTSKPSRLCQRDGIKKHPASAAKCF
nr:MAG TPA: hypothetical protein [Caudoviricetes sp.]